MVSHEQGFALDLSMPVEEAYKSLRTNIKFCGVINEIKTMTITSCAPGEGKTTTTINLGMSMANAGMKILIINADLRRPMAEKLLGIDSDIGITTYITGEKELADVIFSTQTEGLYISPCGPIPPNPTELLGSDKFTEFTKTVGDMNFDFIGGKFDMILFDTPPLGSVIDAAIVAAQTSATLLVVKSRSINYKLAQSVKEQLEKANANVVGVVLNQVKKSDYQYQYGYRYGYNYKYYSYYVDDVEKKSFILEKILKKLFKKKIRRKTRK